MSNSVSEAGVPPVPQAGRNDVARDREGRAVDDALEDAVAALGAQAVEPAVVLGVGDHAMQPAVDPDLLGVMDEVDERRARRAGLDLDVAAHDQAVAGAGKSDAVPADDPAVAQGHEVDLAVGREPPAGLRGRRGQ